MLRLHEGWDYVVYRSYLVLGIAALLGGPILAALIFRENFPYARYGVAYMIGLSGWVVGILLYWWWVFLFKDSRAPQAMASQASAAVPSVSALQNLTSLHRAMSLHGGNIEMWRKAQWAGKRPVLEFFGWQNALVLWILGSVWAGILDLFPGVDPVVLPVGVVILTVITIVRIPFLVRRSSEGFSEAYLQPLGLNAVESPVTKLQWWAFLTGSQAVVSTESAVIAGRRHGRSIRIELLDGQTRTLVQGKTANFKLHSPDGKLRLDGEGPEAVRLAVKSLRKARRWRGIQVGGGPQGIAIIRESGRQNMWLYDLWLVEYLLGKQRGPDQ